MLLFSFYNETLKNCIRGYTASRVHSWYCNQSLLLQIQPHTILEETLFVANIGLMRVYGLTLLILTTLALIALVWLKLMSIINKGMLILKEA